MSHRHDLFNDSLPDTVFKLWKKEGYESMSRPPSFAVNILERLGQLNHWTENPSLLDEASTSIRKLDVFQKFLSSYLASVQEIVDALRVAVRPFSFGRGINTLPDEILSMIFESFGTDEYNVMVRRCSLVSRRFHRVVLNTPRIWCNVSSGMNSTNSVIRHLERSKSIGLNVQIIPKPRYSFSRTPYVDQLEFLDVVISHKERWESFELDISAASNPLDIWDRFNKSMHFPRLKDLCIALPEGPEVLEEVVFLKSLCAPQLRRLHAINCLPGPSALSSMLTSLKIELSEFAVDPQLCGRLYALLRSVENLAEASLTLECYGISLLWEIEFTPFILRNLKVLEFTISSASCDELLSFRKSLITPAIVNCVFSVWWSEIACSRHSDGSLSANYLEFILCHDEYPTLETLSVHFYAMENRIARFTIPLKKVPNLHNLTIDTPGFYPVFDSVRIPALRSLTIRRIGAREWSRFSYVWYLLRKQGDLPGLQKVVIGNRVVSQELAEEIFAGGGYGLR